MAILEIVHGHDERLVGHDDSHRRRLINRYWRVAANRCAPHGTLAHSVDRILSRHELAFSVPARSFVCQGLRPYPPLGLRPQTPPCLRRQGGGGETVIPHPPPVGTG